MRSVPRGREPLGMREFVQAGNYVSTKAEEFPLSEAVTKQRLVKDEKTLCVLL